MTIRRSIAVVRRGIGPNPLAGVAALDAMFAARGWAAFDFQRQAWNRYLAGGSALVHAPTGAGKTLSVFGGPLAERLNEPVAASKSRAATDPLTVLWLTPMRALANDSTHALDGFCRDLKMPWSVELRTSDTTQSMKKKQRERLPSVLVSTPESLSILLSYPTARELLHTVKCVVVDEWHELMSTKRGTQTELGIARLASFNPLLRVWGLSATLGNLDEAARALLWPADRTPVVIAPADAKREVEIRTLMPATVERFPWGGHMGLKMVPAVCEAIDTPGCSLVFTNTRAQAELWFKSILDHRPDLMGSVAIHHGSLDRKLRQGVEKLLRDGQLKAVVCTSSLDLGVDFPTVDRVVQIGSPKGIGRLMQRAGRANHRPGAAGVVACVPTHAFEMVEFSAAREGVERRDVEPRPPLRRPLDVLAQHVVTIACGGGFDADELLAEVRQTHAFSDLTNDEWMWVLDFVTRGGHTLQAYQRFAKVARDDAGRYHIGADRLATLHRLGIGTIGSDGVVALVSNSGRKLGTIEEGFISRLKPGDTFVFGGKLLELLGTHQMVARVRPAKKRTGAIPQWAGGRFPLSTRLAEGVRARLEAASSGRFDDDEMRFIKPILDVQARFSHIPTRSELLIETSRSRDGAHWFVFSFLGRLVHEGLGAVIGHRIRQRFGQPVTATFTDYGIEFLCAEPFDADERAWRELLSPEQMVDDLLLCLNAGELTRRQFRGIAQVAGLLVPSSPAAPRSVRQLQASSELFFDVFMEFDPQNLLLQQARREVLEQQLEMSRLTTALESLKRQSIVIRQTARFSPMAFPIWAQRIQSQTVKTESAHDRIERMLAQLERDAQAQPDAAPR
jgi:ATP-dependent helicase Lhr and Lhr-like helicase